MTYAFAVSMFGALFAVMNPFVNLPIFLSLTAESSRAEQRKAAVLITIYTAITCAVVAVAGSAILSFFDISVSAFRVAGGMVLMMIGLHMLNGKESSSHHGTEDEQDAHAEISDITFYPMTFPMLVGPGTMTTLILFANKAKTTADWIGYGACVAVVVGMLGVVLFFAGDIGRFLTNTMRTIMTRIMGMILMAIAVGMVVAGLTQLLPGLAS